MNSHIIVSPLNENLISRFTRRKFVVHTNDIDSVLKANEIVNKHNELHAILILSEQPFSSIPVAEAWTGIPLAIYVPRLGVFKEFITKIDLLRKLNLRTFFSSDNPNVTTESSILSSLGIACGIYFSDMPIHWERMIDLLHYAVYSQGNHAPIEPFQYLVSHYKPLSNTDFSSVYFNDPSRFLHINEKGQIAFTAEELRHGQYFCEGVSSIANIASMQAYQERLNKWQEHFLEFSHCSSCPSWRVCQGKFSDTRNKDSGCRIFFENMLEAAEFYRKKTDNLRGRIWQP
jgi:hypothetical protein